MDKSDENSFNKRAKSDNRSTEELLELAWENFGKKGEEFFDIIEVLQVRGTDEIFEIARKLTESSNSGERELGVAILSQNLVPGKTFGDRPGPILLKMLASEKAATVLAEIGVAFGHLMDARGIEPLVRLKNHLDAEVRFGVVLGISTHQDQLAINTLIELSKDEVERVRDWATFGLGQMIDTNTPEIRQALFERTGDLHAETRGEALVGLATRKDTRVIEPILKELTSGAVGRLAVEAAREIGSPKLYPALVELKEWWDVDNELLAEAIASCESK